MLLSADRRRSHELAPSLSESTGFFIASASMAEVWPSPSVRLISLLFHGKHLLPLLGRFHLRHQGLQRLGGIVQLLGPVGEHQGAVVNGLHTQVFARGFIERAQDERVGVNLLNELVAPIGSVAHVRDRAFDLGPTAS